MNQQQRQPAAPTGQAPCARHCEASAFKIEIRGLHGSIGRMQAIMREATDALQEHVNSLIETHKEPNGVVYGEVAEILRSKCDLIDRMRAAALPWDQRQQPVQADEPDALHLAAVELARQQAARIAELELMLTEPEPARTVQHLPSDDTEGGAA